MPNETVTERGPMEQWIVEHWEERHIVPGESDELQFRVTEFMQFIHEQDRKFADLLSALEAVVGYLELVAPIAQQPLITKARAAIQRAKAS